MDDLLEEIIGMDHQVEYLELRYHKRDWQRFTVQRGELQTGHLDKYAGVGVRVIANGTWGFSATSDLTKNSLLETIQAAKKTALVTSEGKTDPVRLRDVKLATGTFESPRKINPADLSTEEKIKRLLELEKSIRDHDSRIVSGTARFIQMEDYKHILSSDGANFKKIRHGVELGLFAVASEAGDIQNAYEAEGKVGGWEFIEQWNPEEHATKASQLAIDLLSAKHPKGGEQTVILTPSIVGLLAHEAIGHTVEADFVLSGSIAKDKIGQQVASELVTLVDGGNHGPAAGWQPVDDEGVATRDTVVIKDGILQEYLYDRETAEQFNMDPAGNARAWEFSDDMEIRMTNTFINGGDWKPEEILADTKEGLWFTGVGGGQADSTSEFMFVVGEAWRVENGEKVELLKGVTMSGNAFKVLNTIDATADDFELKMGSGACGKGTPAKVDGGGPTLRARLLVGGR